MKKGCWAGRRTEGGGGNKKQQKVSGLSPWLGFLSGTPGSPQNKPAGFGFRLETAGWCEDTPVNPSPLRPHGSGP